MNSAGIRGNQFESESLPKSLSYIGTVLLSWIGRLYLSFIIRLLPFRIPFLEYLGRESMLFYVVYWIPLLVANKLLVLLFPALNVWLLFAISLLTVFVVLLTCALFRNHIPGWCLGENSK